MTESKITYDLPPEQSSPVVREEHIEDRFIEKLRIFEANASLQKIEDTQAPMRTTEDLFQQQLDAYTITHAIEDGNVLRFHIDYFKPEGKNPPKPGEAIAKRAVIEAILSKHDAATGARRFNAILATSSINEAIEYFDLFAETQNEKQTADPAFNSLNIACVFSPPAQLAENAEAKKDIEQLSEDLPQEQEDNKVEPEKKKEALKAILVDYNARYATNHRLSEFDLYCQDVQKRIKDQQWADADLRKAFPNVPHHKIDITIVVDMLLTGFDSKYLNTLYVDKNLNKDIKELAAIAGKHGLATTALQTFVDGILDRMIFDGEHLSDLMAPLDLGWKARTEAAPSLMADLHPLLTKRAGGREISGLSAYEH